MPLRKHVIKEKSVALKNNDLLDIAKNLEKVNGREIFYEDQKGKL